MKHLFLHIVLILIGGQILLADTPINGGIINNGYWDKAGSPYIILGDLVIENLIIEPGVQVQFNANYRFQVEGILQAAGFFSDSIIFKASENNPDGSWWGIELRSSANYIVMNYCRVQDTRDYGLRIDGISIVPEINHCDILGSLDEGIYVKDTQIGLKHCRIRGNISAGIIVDNSNLILTNVIIDHNQGDGIISTDNHDVISLTNTVVADNAGIGINCRGGTFTINNSIIAGNQTEITWSDPEPVVTYSDVQGDLIWPGEGNINANPGFADRILYTLADTSRCIDQGDSTSVSFNDLYFPPSKGDSRNDMGAYGGPDAGDWYPPIYINPESVHFGSVAVDSNLTRQITVYNYRDAVITVPTISFAETSNGLFSVVPENFFLIPLGSRLLDVSFCPDTQGTFISNMVLQTTAYGTISIPFQGDGIAPVIHVPFNELNFDTLSRGDSETISFVIANSGTDILNISSMHLSNHLFEISDSTLIVEPGSESDSVIVTFKPLRTGNYQDWLIISSNDPENPYLIFSVRGYGTGPVIVLSSDSLDYGMVSVDSMSVKEIEIGNEGNLDLAINRIQLIDQMTNAFMLHDSIVSDPILIQPDSSFSIELSFTPVAAGQDGATLQVESNDPYLQETYISLSGVGAAPQIEVSTRNLDFGQLPLESDSIRFITISNTGTIDLIIYADSIRKSGPDAGQFNVLIGSGEILVPVDSSLEVGIQFDPDRSGPANATITFVHNDPVNPDQNIQVNGLAFDKNPASISIDNENSTQPLVNGQKATRAFTITSHSAVDSAFIFFRQGGQRVYVSFRLDNPSGNIWLTELSANLISERGIEYYIQAYHGWRETYHPEKADEEPLTEEVNVPILNYPEQTGEGSYQMISVPVATAGQSLADLYVNNLGKYDNTHYRLFNCLDGATYSELTSMSDSLPPGKALWLITKNSTQLDIANARSVRTDQVYSIQLQQGWNMIASPFAFTVDWSEVSDVLALRSYENSDWGFSDRLEPYTGYAVKVSEATEIHIPSQEALESMQKNFSDLSPVAAEWQIRISAEGDRVRDSYNYAGVIEQAVTGIDRFDFAEPPPIGNYISLFLLPGDDKVAYSTDFREPELDGYQFNFTMQSNIAGPKSICFAADNIPEAYEWKVVSTDTKVIHGQDDILTNNQQGNFRLVVGIPSYIKEVLGDYYQVPIDYVLDQNYPNPFNPKTTIKYQIPMTNDVELRIYNLLGQKVATLVFEKQDVGYHQVEWDARQIASGVYYYVLKAGQFQDVKKMILLR